MRKILNLNVIYIILFIVIMISFYVHSLYYPYCCDVEQYLHMGQSYATSNTMIMPSNFSGLRLYGYPFFVSIFYKFIPDYVNIGIFITQVAIYILVSHFIAKSICVVFNSKYEYIFYPLLFNIFLMPYLAIPLTDALSVIIWMSIGLMIIKLYTINSDELNNDELIYSLFFGFFIGLSIMIRPSNIHLMILLILIPLLRSHSFKKIIILSFIGFIVAVFPQIYINYTVFGTFSFLPNVKLGDLQIQWGIEYIKYATNLSGIGTAQLFYHNPFYLNSEIANLNWYFSNPIQGIKTIFLHIFGALNFDYLFPYIYELTPRYQILLILYSSSILFFGIYGYTKLINILWKNRQINLNKNALQILLIIIPVVIFGWMAIIGLSAVENRFSLPIITFLMPFAFFGLHHLRNNKKFLLLFCIYLILAYLLSDFISMQKTYIN